MCTACRGATVLASGDRGPAATALLRDVLAHLFAELREEAAGVDDGPEIPQAPENAFEQWLVDRWLRDIRSDDFRDSVQGERLMAEWERR